jgi:hypothetical protein
LEPELITLLARNDDLQQLLIEDEPFQDLIAGVVRMNETDRTYVPSQMKASVMTIPRVPQVLPRKTMEDDSNGIDCIGETLVDSPDNETLSNRRIRIEGWKLGRTNTGRPPG